MARYIILAITLVFFGCEMNGEQIIKPHKLTFSDLKFDSVSKELFNKFYNNSPNHEKTSQIINYWFENKIKSNGFDGHLIVTIKKMDIIEHKKVDYFRFSINLEIILIEKTLDKINKTYSVKADEYGEIKGNFSIKDQENLSLNIMHQSVDSVSKKLIELI